MSAVPAFIIEPLWSQFAALIPKHADNHPLGCHRPRIDDRIVFDKLVWTLVWGCSYAKIADTTCSATTLRTRRDEWIAAGIFTRLEDLWRFTIASWASGWMTPPSMAVWSRSPAEAKPPGNRRMTGKTRHQTLADGRHRQDSHRLCRGRRQP